MTEKMLGKITNVSFGIGGYQDAMFGISFDLGGEGWGVGDFWGWWSSPPSTGAKWTKEDQDAKFAGVSHRIIKLLEDAKTNDVAKLKGKPVEVIFEKGMLKSWRILTEVL